MRRPIPAVSTGGVGRSFVQAYLGDDETLYLHVPGAMVLSIGSVWLLVWSLTPQTRS